MKHGEKIGFSDIRQRAYELWDRHHRPGDFEQQFWLMAEHELSAERTPDVQRTVEPVKPSSN